MDDWGEWQDIGFILIGVVLAGLWALGVISITMLAICVGVILVMWSLHRDG